MTFRMELETKMMVFSATQYNLPWYAEVLNALSRTGGVFTILTGIAAAFVASYDRPRLLKHIAKDLFLLSKWAGRKNDTADT